MNKKNPTIVDIAELTGFSISTVSRVINGPSGLVKEETRKKILKVIDDLEYVPNHLARNLRTKRNNIVMLILPDIANPFWSEVAKGTQDFLESRGYIVVIASSDWKGEREIAFTQQAQHNRFSGIIIAPADLQNDDLLDLNMPIVVLGYEKNYQSFDTVRAHTEEGIRTAMKYLLDLGNQRIGILGGLSRRKTKSERIPTYENFLNEHHIEFDDSLVVSCDYSLQAGNIETLKMLKIANPPSAILAGNDILAIGALQAIIGAGLNVPNDVQLIGMDDIFATTVTTPKLTTMRKQKYEIGYKAAEFLLERISGESISYQRHLLLPCELIERGTTKKIH